MAETAAAQAKASADGRRVLVELLDASGKAVSAADLSASDAIGLAAQLIGANDRTLEMADVMARQICGRPAEVSGRAIPPIPAGNLWELDVYDAMEVRWLQGRARYGEEWRGRHPLVEAHEEAIDMLVYLAVARGEGSPVDSAIELLIRTIAESMAKQISGHFAAAGQGGRSDVG